MRIKKRWLYDAGVKGMKKGQHVKAKDPDYVKSLKRGALTGAGTAMIAGGAVEAATGGAISGGIKNVASNIKNKVGDPRMRFAQAKSAASNKFNAAKEVFKYKREGLLSKLNNARQSIASGLSNAKESVRNVTNKIGTAASKAGNAAKNLGNKIYGHAQNAASVAHGYAKEGASAAKKLGGKVMGAMPKTRRGKIGLALGALGAAGAIGGGVALASRKKKGRDSMYRLSRKKNHKLTTHDSMPWCKRKRHNDFGFENIGPAPHIEIEPVVSPTLVIKALLLASPFVFTLIKTILNKFATSRVFRALLDGKISEREYVNKLSNKMADVLEKGLYKHIFSHQIKKSLKVEAKIAIEKLRKVTSFEQLKSIYWNKSLQALLDEIKKIRIAQKKRGVKISRAGSRLNESDEKVYYRTIAENTMTGWVG